MEKLIIGAIFFIIGNVSGYFLHDFIKRGLKMSESDSKTLIVVSVTMIWVIAMIVSLINPLYQVPLPLHTIMGGIVGYFFYKGKEEKK